MNRFNSYKRKVGVAIALLSTLLGGNISSAKNINHVPNQSVRLSQTTRKADETSITSNKLFKPLAITATVLIVSGLVGFTIWGLTRNKKESDTPKKENDNKGNIKSEIQGEKSKKEINEQNDEKQIITEKEIAEHNKNLICNAIALAKKENKLHCDEDSLKNAMFELFDRLAKLEYGEYGKVNLLWRYFHTDKIFNISIEEFTNEKNKKENGVFLYLDNDNPKKAYGISWLPDNKVSISYSTEMLGEIFTSYQIFENLKSPFEVKN